ncbi:hypothetical protein C0995_013252 [Termitomyces sp. Mi166|nr:hypothetical protein C0995_013252 [Termitomyces sp. Mi166\
MAHDESKPLQKTRVILVGVGGATCSGKTTLAKHLRRILPDSVIIHQDDFAPPQELVPIHPIYNVQDWDAAPGAILWPKLVHFLREVKATGKIPNDHRSHDHLNEQREIQVDDKVRDQWIDVFEGIRKERERQGEKLIWGLVDGFLLYWDQDLKRLADKTDGRQEVIDELDVRIFLRVPEPVLRKRRHERHGYHTAEGSLWRDPPGYWEQIVYPAYVDAHRDVFIGGDIEGGLPGEKVKGLVVINILELRMNEAVSAVIVVGGGLAGLSAAHTLLERGANVLLLDKQGFMGGNSTKATSGINGAGTQSQQALGIPDNAQIFFEDTKKSARDLARDDLIRVLTGRSGDAVNWLQAKFGLDLSKVSRLGGHSQPRTHRGDAQFPGMVITYAQLERLEDLAVSTPERVRIIKKARVTKLLKDESNSVVGVEYSHDGKTQSAYGPVILATGGYAADFTEDSLLKKYRPEFWNLPTTNGDHCTGDGQKLAMAIGANGIDLEKVQVHPTGLVDPKEPDAKVKFLAAEALRGVGGLLLDSQGKRFVDELQHRDYVTGKIWENKHHPIRLVLNGAASKEIEWHCKHYVGRGLMKRFDNGNALAKEFGLDPSVLRKTFEDYNQIVRTKKDPFGKKFFQGEWSFDDFFHVAMMTPVLHYTMGGLEIDPESRVLDKSGKPITGLFAAGEVAGGVHGANRLGGSSLLGCVVFGRVSGDSAAAYLLQAASAAVQKAGGRLSAISSQLGSAPSPAAEPTSAPATVPGKTASGSYSVEEVAKHNKKDDVWVIIDGQVLDVTKFLPDHPGGEKAILLYAGRDATEEFNMLHDPKVIPRYASDSVIGKVKA